MCTGIRFTDNGGNMYFGRNLDWSEGYGEKVVITPRNYQYKSAFLGVINGPAVIGMAVVAENMPLYFDCANEHGLAVAGLNFPGYTAYVATPVEGKTNVSSYEFPLWVTLKFKTVDEVEKTLRNVAVVAKPVNEQYQVGETHWLIGDKKRSIVVEYTEHGIEIFENEVDVLTNQPGYGWHKENLRNYLNLSSETPQEVEWSGVKMTAFGAGALIRGLPGDYYSPSRFVRAAYLNTHYPSQVSETDNVARLFHTLAGVSMIDGVAAMADGKFEKTIYTGGYSSGTKTYYYNTYEEPAIQNVRLENYDLDSSGLIVVEK